MGLSRIPKAFGVAALAAGLLMSPRSLLAEENTCLECHEDQKNALAASVHPGLTCLQCHGGDPAGDVDTAHKTKDFKPLSDKRDIVAKCTSCHSDVRMMNPFGLPADQLERYKTSKHGEQLLQHGDQKVAACADCHGAHDILKSKTPQSRTYPANIAETCARCHSDAKLMEGYKLPSDVVAQYKTSYHAHLLYEKGDLSAPNCVTCHGNHGATPPGTREVGQVCGKCHGRQAELFEKSPHASLLSSGKFSECVSCHGNHAIQKASLQLFDETCSRCHVPGDGPTAVRDSLVATLRKVKLGYEQASKRVHQAERRGLATDEEQLALGEAKTQLTQLEALQHTLSPETLAPVAVRAEQIIGQTIGGVEALERVEQWKRLALVPIWLFFIVMGGLCWLKWRELTRRRR